MEMGRRETEGSVTVALRFERRLGRATPLAQQLRGYRYPVKGAAVMS